ncbi:MAG: branched-chain amino acid ABC transporter permease, partial [Thermodesulfobacteriota bacterium]
MKASEEFKKSFFISLWFMLLTFPILVIRVNTIEKVVEWRWRNMAFIGIGSFLLSFVWRRLLSRKEKGRQPAETGNVETLPLGRRLLAEPRIYRPALTALALFTIAFPLLFSSYQTNIMTTALIYVMLGLGLNIVVGLAGLLDLGYVAFYAVGAYSYALLNHHFGLGFWAILPVGGLLGALFGILLGFP